ncbi:C-type lectin domain family 4 member M-like [Sphaeramia orbicularis]|uniref:C-type lectin domain family 4 member M-like n=1 Tax=Sphaeramia orbicularis TaxID=375764 RepID=UPI00117C9243|nr:C-type lectin domain family 4 member M-like [Sphaeramia orbicularis]
MDSLEIDDNVSGFENLTMTRLITPEKEDLESVHLALTTERNEFKASVNNLTDEKDQLKESYNILKQTSDQLQMSYDALQADHNVLTESKDELQNNYATLQTEKDELQTRLSSVEAHRNQLRLLLSNYTALRREKDRLQRQFDYLNLRRDLLETSYSSLFKAKDRLQYDLTNTQRRNQQLQTSRDQLQKMVNEMEAKIRGMNCQMGWRKFGMSCYFTSGSKKNWTESRKACIAEGSDLVIINTGDEQAFVNSLLNSGENAWIGLTDSLTEGEWKWVDGTPVTTAYWQPGQPNNKFVEQDCGEIVQNSPVGDWNDDGCFADQKWICEK